MLLLALLLLAPSLASASEVYAPRTPLAEIAAHRAANDDRCVPRVYREMGIRGACPMPPTPVVYGMSNYPPPIDPRAFPDRTYESPSVCTMSFDEETGVFQCTCGDTPSAPRPKPERQLRPWSGELNWEKFVARFVS